MAVDLNASASILVIELGKLILDNAKHSKKHCGGMLRIVLVLTLANVTVANEGHLEKVLAPKLEKFAGIVMLVNEAQD